MTASTVIVTLSLVITSCGGTSITCSRISTTINLSIPGITIFKPEVASRLYLPNLSIKPFSNGLKILNILKATNTKRPNSMTLLTSEKINSIMLFYY